jgi:hypothetical protein
MTRAKAREFGLFFVTQCVSYILVVVNQRAVTHSEYLLTALSDFALGSLGFFLLRKIVKSDDALHQWLGYALGGVAGGIIGIIIAGHLGV